MTANELVAKLHWLGHDSFRLEGPPRIYFDPWKLKGSLLPADLILVSHEHHDHCSPDDIAKIRGKETIVLAPTGALAQLPGARAVVPGDQLHIAGVDIEAVPAYNTNKFRSPGVPFHPRESNHVGYIVSVQGIRLYFAGDTDHIPEMAGIECNIALLPVSGTYVMTVDEALAAAETLDPDIVVPMHFGSGIGTSSDGQQFADRYSGQTILLNN